MKATLAGTEAVKEAAASVLYLTEHVCGKCAHRCTGYAPIGQRIYCEHRCAK